MGRQPWIVYRLLKTSEAVSKTLSTGEVLFSLLLFGSLYLLLFVLFVYLLYRKVLKGPPPEPHALREGKA
jgi:cytochrome d ubiquinol oxidase subunit I